MRRSFVALGMLSAVVSVMLCGCPGEVSIEEPDVGSLQVGDFDTYITWSEGLSPANFEVTLNNVDITDAFDVSGSSAEATISTVPGGKLMVAGMGTAYDQVDFTVTSEVGLETFLGGALNFTCLDSFMLMDVVIPGIEDLGLSETLCEFFQIVGVFPSGASVYPQTPILPYLFGVFPMSVTFQEHPTIFNALWMSTVHVDLDLPYNPDEEGAICGLQCDLDGILFPVQEPIPGREHAVITEYVKNFRLWLVDNGECVLKFDPLGGQTVFVLNYGAVMADETPPVLTLDSPQNGFVDTASVPVSGTTTDDSLLPPDLTVNGSPIAVDAGSGAFSEPYALVYGENMLTVLARDGSGNETTVERQVTLDTVEPVLVVLEPPVDAVVNDLYVTVSGTASDDLGAPVVKVNGNVVPVDPGKGTFSTTVIVLPGANEILVEAEDGINHVEETRQVTFEVTSFVLSVIEPDDGAVTGGASVDVVGVAVDETMVVPAVTINGTPVTVDPDLFTFSGTVALASGSNTITCVADNGVDVLNDVRQVISDVIGPELTVDTPAEGEATAELEIVVSGTATDDLFDPTVSVNGSPAAVDPVTGAFSTAVGLIPGSNTIEIEAHDPVNVTSVERTVIVDQTPPILVVLLPFDGASTNNTTTTVLGFAYDERVGAPTVTVNGLVVDVDPDLFVFLAEVALDPGPNTVTIVASDGAGEVVVERAVTRQ